MKRFAPIAAAFTCILLVTAFVFRLTPNEERPHSDEELLSIAALRSNEELVVSTMFSHRRAVGREYRVRAEGARRTVTVFDTTPEWSREDGTASGNVLVMRSLSDAEIAGLDETITCYRDARKRSSSVSRHIRILHIRDGKQIGEEFYAGISLPEEVAWTRWQNADLAREYSDFSQWSGISTERIYRMIPFEMLEKEEPNQALQPTAPSGRG